MYQCVRNEHHLNGEPQSTFGAKVFVTLRMPRIDKKHLHSKVTSSGRKSYKLDNGVGTELPPSNIEVAKIDD